MLGRLSSRRTASDAAQAIQACNIYVSEGRNEIYLGMLKGACLEQKNVALVNTFTDLPYNRTGFTFASHNTDALAEAAVRLARIALLNMDMRQHAATHPRLGTVDHISCHPLTAAATLQDTAALSRRIGQGLGEGVPAIPVFLYGEASSRKASLADLRRALGYFKGSSAGSWKGSTLPALLSETHPDFGPSEVAAEYGLAMVGATPWVTNYNIPLSSCDMQIARRIATAVSERGGGIPGVQAMALPHGKDVEIACNLLLTEREDLMDTVLERVTSLCQEADISVGQSYRIGLSADEYAEMAANRLGI